MRSIREREGCEELSPPLRGGRGNNRVDRAGNLASASSQFEVQECGPGSHVGLAGDGLEA